MLVGLYLLRQYIYYWRPIRYKTKTWRHVLFKNKAGRLFMCSQNKTRISRTRMSASVCRVCLSGNLKMNRIENIELKNIFERLTSLKAPGGGAECVCYLCHAQLQRCRRFAAMARRSHAIFSDALLQGLQVTQESLASMNVKGTAFLSVSSAPSMHTLYVHHSHCGGGEATVKEEVSVKVELPPDSDNDNDIDIDFEPVLQDTKPDKNDDCKQEKQKRKGATDKPSRTKKRVRALAAKQERSDPTGTKRRKTRITEEARTCEFCKKVFKRRTDLRVHRRVHTGERPYRCDLCQRAFATSSTLIGHKATHVPLSERAKPFSCTHCDKAFTQKETLQQHIRIHGERKFACEICGKAFVTQIKMKIHMRRHVTERVHTCDRCARTYKTGEDLRHHMLVHSGARPFPCGACDKAFARSQELKLHMRVHTGEKPYACDICGKTFSQSSTLRVHIRTHSAERPFPCTLCALRFKDKSTRAQHVARHAAGPPAECAVCGRECASRRYAAAHARSHSRAPAPRPACRCGKTFTNASHLRRHERNVRCGATEPAPAPTDRSEPTDNITFNS